ncbi:hypothetical protein OSTOST_21255 [Ostertagia ostertagi]
MSRNDTFSVWKFPFTLCLYSSAMKHMNWDDLQSYRPYQQFSDDGHLLDIDLWRFEDLFPCDTVIFRALNYFKVRASVPATYDPLLLMSATEAVRKIAKREITSQQLVAAYMHRIEQVNEIINAVVVKLFVEASKKAEEIDKSIADMDDHQLEEVPTLYPDQYSSNQGFLYSFSSPNFEASPGLPVPTSQGSLEARRASDHMRYLCPKRNQKDIHCGSDQEVIH